MNSLRNLIALLLLVLSTAALAQNITITVSASAGGAVDTMARNLGTGLHAILGKKGIVNNAGGEYGARAVRLFRTAPADGSQILVLHATVGQPAPDISGLVPIAAILGEFRTYRWIGVFAPPSTPAGIVMDLERAVLIVLKSPGFGQQVSEYKLPSDSWVGSHLTPGDGAILAGLVAQSAGDSGGGGGGGTASGSTRPPTASGSASLGGTVELVWLTPPGNLKSRNECLKVEWITAPLARDKAGDTKLIDPKFFGNGHDLQQRQLVVYSICAENIVLTAGSCSEDTMLKSAEHVGTSFNTNFINRGVATDVRLLVASEYSTDSRRGEDKRHAPRKVFVGALLRSDLIGASGYTEGGESHARKVQALLANARVVLGIAPGQNVSGKSWSPNNRSQGAGVKSCSSFTAEAAWNSTR